jgi:hypothetical protein
MPKDFLPSGGQRGHRNGWKISIPDNGFLKNFFKSQIMVLLKAFKCLKKKKKG